jgi:hypothetical protein
MNGKVGAMSVRVDQETVVPGLLPGRAGWKDR